MNDEYFKCDYDLVEILTGRNVSEDNSKKFGCDVHVIYEGELVEFSVFDGTYNYEYKINIHIPTLIDVLKEDIRKDTTQYLYDTRLVCKDIAGLISSYVC